MPPPRESVKNFSRILPCLFTGVLLLIATRSAIAETTNAPARKTILAEMERVADWQIVHSGTHPTTSWTQGVCYAGMMALDAVSTSPRFRERMLVISGSNQWKPGRSKYLADDQAVTQTYIELWQRYHDPKMIAPTRKEFDYILAHPWQLPTLEIKQKAAHNLWSWCDALFMAPPAWVRMAQATGDEKYRDFAVSNWWRTSDYLYDAQEHLFYRDSTFFTKKAPNGAKVFWSRGNGWVLAGLARTMEYLEPGTPGRQKMEVQYRAMAARILSLQQPDGLWRVSLLDPTDYNWKETSGSALFAYGLAWGINHHLLDRDTYEPAVLKTWNALTRCVTPVGMLTDVQPIGAAPVKGLKPNSTEVYGTGAFLLAGSEIYKMVSQ